MGINSATELKAVEYLPLHIKEKRELILKETIDFITSEAFLERKIIEEMQEKNSEYINEMLALLEKPKTLRERADFLLNRAVKMMAEIYKDKQVIIIPWSGGRDSSSLLVLSSIFFPDKKYKLITILNGMTQEIENPAIQYKRLLNEIGAKSTFDIEHYFIDCVNEIKQYVIETAHDDKEKLGCPAICSSCKIIMEKVIAKVAKMSNSTDVVLGYAEYQGIRNWIEQSPEQIKFMQKVLLKEGVNTCAPLYHVLKFPFDVMLLLSAMGIKPEYQKQEMKCAAGGLNPRDLDKIRLVRYLEHKNKQTNKVFDNEPKIIKGIPKDKSPYENLIRDILALKADKQYRQGL